jgi:hypothetical protein
VEHATPFPAHRRQNDFGGEGLAVGVTADENGCRDGGMVSRAAVYAGAAWQQRRYHIGVVPVS